MTGDGRLGTSGKGPLRGIVRISLALSLFAFGCYAAVLTTALAVRGSSLDLSYRLAPGNARILELRSQTVAAGATSPKDWNVATDLARQAILRDPLSPGAVAVLGLGAGTRGDADRANRLFRYSTSISRRDLKTSLWLIEQAVERGDITAALHHYDVALRTSRQAPTVLFPVLQGAMSDAKIREQLSTALSQPAARVWAVPFVRAIAIGGPDFLAVADLFNKLHARGFDFPPGTEASLIGALVGASQYDAAWTYLAHRESGLSRDQSRDARFRQHDPVPSPFDWNPLSAPGLASALQRSGSDGAFTFSAASGVGGIVLRQLMVLPPGTYRVTSHLANLTAGAPSPRWIVQCVDGAKIGDIALSTGRAQRPVMDMFQVAADCPAQWLSLSILPFDAVGGVEGMIDQAHVAPALPVKAMH